MVPHQLDNDSLSEGVSKLFQLMGNLQFWTN